MRRHSILVSLLAVVLAAAPAITDSVAETVRGHKVHRGSSHHGSRHHGGYYRGGRTHISVGFGYYGYYPGYAYYGYPYAWYGPPAYVGYGGYYGTPVAYIDTDVSPEDASVFIDGEYVGIADSFDGYPRYLSVEPGSHTVTFKFDGYRTWTRTLNAHAGSITKLRFEMTAGEGIDERSEPATEPDDARPAEGAGEPGAVQIAPESEDEAPGFVRLNVSPPGATVYLDGEFYAPASTLARLHGDLRLERGVHVIEVVIPGYETSTRRIELAPGDRLTLSIDLRKADR